MGCPKVISGPRPARLRIAVRRERSAGRTLQRLLRRRRRGAGPGRRGSPGRWPSLRRRRRSGAGRAGRGGGGGGGQRGPSSGGRAARTMRRPRDAAALLCALLGALLLAGEARRGGGAGGARAPPARAALGRTPRLPSLGAAPRTCQTPDRRPGEPARGRGRRVGVAMSGIGRVVAPERGGRGPMGGGARSSRTPETARAGTPRPAAGPRARLCPESVMLGAAAPPATRPARRAAPRGTLCGHSSPGRGPRRTWPTGAAADPDTVRSPRHRTPALRMARGQGARFGPRGAVPLPGVGATGGGAVGAGGGAVARRSGCGRHRPRGPRGSDSRLCPAAPSGRAPEPRGRAAGTGSQISERPPFKHHGEKVKYETKGDNVKSPICKDPRVQSD